MQEQHPRITISIYQNSEHVGSILQQAFRRPLVTDESWERHSEDSKSTGHADEVGAGVGFEFKVPMVGSATGSANFGDSSSVDQRTAMGMKSTQNFVYSQATYLYLVRDRLQHTEQLKRVASLTDARQLQVGDFVEYEASFRANEITAILDVLTPELVAEIASHTIRREGLTYFEIYNDFEERKRMLERLYAKADMSANLAHAITSAVRADFRSEKTKEFYGAFGPDGDRITAITICDKHHFVVDDEDRILDGVFTVLGKVVSPVETDVPILSRNKILERFRPAGVDAAFQLLRDAASSQGENRSPAWQGLGASDLFDLDFSSRIDGASFRVIPVAIYA